MAGLAAALGTAASVNLPMLAVGGGLDLLLSAIGGWGEEELAKMDRDTKLKIAADQLGFDYAQLSQQDKQFQSTIQERADQFMGQLGLDRQTLAQRRKEAMQKYELGKEGLQLQREAQATEKAFGTSDRLRSLSQERKEETRKAGIRGAFSTKATGGRPIAAVKPTANMGTDALAKRPEQKPPQAPSASTGKKKTSGFPLNMGA